MLYLLSMSRNVRDTSRFVPQLSTVTVENALPLMPAGKISLSSNQDTVEASRVGQVKRATGTRYRGPTIRCTASNIARLYLVTLKKI